jgi:hypothetical protein
MDNAICKSESPNHNPGVICLNREEPSFYFEQMPQYVKLYHGDRCVPECWALNGRFMLC